MDRPADCSRRAVRIAANQLASSYPGSGAWTLDGSSLEKIQCCARRCVLSEVVPNVEPAGPETPPPLDIESGPHSPPLPSPLRDPEFASTTATSIETGDLIPSGIAPEYYIRLIANPFLGFAGLVGWLMGLIWVFGQLRQNLEMIGPMSPIIFAVLLACLALLPGLFQYQCLDCGRSGRMSEWRRHACPSSALRRLTGRPRRLRGPPPPIQVVLWLWFLLMAGLILPRFGVEWRFLLR